MAWQDRPYHRNEGSFQMRFGFGAPGKMTLSIVIACVLGFAIQQTSDAVWRWGALTRDTGLIQPWRLITYQFLHADSWHIFFNLLVVYFFLNPLERLWGPAKALAFYTAGGVVAGLAFMLLAVFLPVDPRLIGASGSALAALGACALLFPEMTVYLIVIPVPIRLLALLIGLLYTLSIIGERDLSNAAHLGGLVFGIAGPYWCGPMWSRFARRRQHRRLQRITMEEQHEQEVVDRILQKVHDQGMHSLSWRERRTLRQATQRQRQRDEELAARRRL